MNHACIYFGSTEQTIRYVPGGDPCPFLRRICTMRISIVPVSSFLRILFIILPNGKNPKPRKTENGSKSPFCSINYLQKSSGGGGGLWGGLSKMTKSIGRHTRVSSWILILRTKLDFLMFCQPCYTATLHCYTHSILNITSPH